MRSSTFILSVFLAAWSAQCRADNKIITLNAQGEGRIFEGIGAVSAGASSRLLIDYPEPYRSQILDCLFKPGFGAALQHLKVEIGADVDSTDGAEPSHARSPEDRNYTRGYEWWLMREARKRNPDIILDALPWGAPGWIREGKIQSPDMTEYVADFIQGSGSNGLRINYVGILNERDDDPAYVAQLRQALDRRGLGVKIVCCDLEQPSNRWSIVDALVKKADLRDAVAVIGVHYPTENGKLTTPAAARKLGMPLWSSEDQPNPGVGPFLSRDWAVGGRILARRYIRNYLEGTLTKTEIWSPVTSYYDILPAPNSGLMIANTPWSGYYEVPGAIWATAHTTQFARPGWRYLDSASGYLPDKGSYVSLLSPNGKDWSLVLETIDARKPQRVQFVIHGDLASTKIHVWETNSSKTFEHVADLEPQEGKFSFVFDPDSLYSLTTTVGQGRGTAQPPSAKPFPLPYRDNFETTPVGRAPRFLSDQDGAFEAQPCRFRRGRCLEQVITLQPLPWAPLPDPFTLAGDANWADYRVEADFLIDGEGRATFMGRIDSADAFQDLNARWPSGYVLSLESDGRWSLFSSSYHHPVASLASGKASPFARKWHHAELRFQGDRISAAVDGQPLARIEDGSHRHGLFALGTGWNHAQFDNLVVDGADRNP